MNFNKFLFQLQTEIFLFSCNVTQYIISVRDMLGRHGQEQQCPSVMQYYILFLVREIRQINFLPAVLTYEKGIGWDFIMFSTAKRGYVLGCYKLLQDWLWNIGSVADLVATQPKRCSISGRGNILSFSMHPYWFWGAPSFLI
jgi:hypothetical protein